MSAPNYAGLAPAVVAPKTIVDYLTYGGRQRFMLSREMITLCVTLWQQAIADGVTTEGFQSKSVQNWLLGLPEVSQAIIDQFAEEVATYTFQGLTGLPAIVASASFQISVYAQSKRNGETWANFPELLAAKLASGEFVKTGVNGQVNDPVIVKPWLEEQAKFQAMGLNTTPNNSGLGGIARLGSKNIAI